MYEYSPLDGFAEISEELGSMIKSLANEPSVGLFYVQEHTHNAVPNLVDLRTKIVSKSRDISLHTEDSEDSITMVRSMTDCGFPIVDDMIKDVTKCLAIMSSKHPRKGLISSRSVFGFKTGRMGQTTWRGSVDDMKKSITDENGSANAMPNVGEELPVSSRVSTGNQEDEVVVDKLLFEEFKAGKEARFEEWLDGNDDSDNTRVK